MVSSGWHIKVLTIVLLLVQLCLPVSGAVYFADHLQASAAGYPEISCVHSDTAADHESTEGHEQIPHCHELDAPCDTLSDAVVTYKHKDESVAQGREFVEAMLPTPIMLNGFIRMQQVKERMENMARQKNTRSIKKGQINPITDVLE